MCKTCAEEDFNNYKKENQLNSTTQLQQQKTKKEKEEEKRNTILSSDVYGEKPEKKVVKKDTYMGKPAVKGNDPFSGQFDFIGTIDEMQLELKKQLGGADKHYLQLNDEGSIFLIPGENLDSGVLCGTNCFAVGTGKRRFLIDACKKDHDIFLTNIACFVEEQDCYFERIFITHSHYDHMDGAMNLIELMQSLDRPTPKVCKFVDGNPSEIARIENNPGLEKHMLHVQEGDVFTLDGLNAPIQFMPIDTPGHLSDHLCYLIKEMRNSSPKYSLFTGDSIIGAASTFFMDYPQYFNSLLKTREIIEKHNIELIYVAHSLTLKPESIGLPAKKKVDEYIERRMARDKQIERVAFLLARGNLGKFTITEYYDFQKQMSKSKKLKQEAETYFKYMLDKQLKKLVVDGKFSFENKSKEYVINDQYYPADMTYSKL